MIVPAFAAENQAETQSAQTEETPTEQAQVLFYENFESYNTGTTSFSGYGGSAKTNSWKVTANSEGGKYLRMVVNTTSDMHLDKNFSAGSITDHFVVTFDVMFEDYNNVVKALFLKSTSGAELGVIRFLPNGTVTLADGYIIANYGTGKFYNVAIAVDTTTNTANIYFNGKKRAANVSLGATPFTDLIMVRFHMREVKGHSNASIDNLGVYSGKKPLDEETLNKLLNGNNEDPNADAPNSTTVPTVNVDLANTVKNSVALYASKNCALV